MYSRRTDCKIKVISRKFIATTQTIIFTLFVLQYIYTINSLEYTINSLEITLILQPARSDVKIGTAYAQGNKVE